MRALIDARTEAIDPSTDPNCPEKQQKWVTGIRSAVRD